MKAFEKALMASNRWALIILLAAMAANVAVNLHYPEYADRFPFIGAAVWVALNRLLSR